MTATLIFFAFTTPFGIAAHLLSELFGLGWHDDADVILSPRHAYLAIFVFITFAGIVAALATLPHGARRARVESLIDDLPFQGGGIGFAALSFVAQFGFFALTQIGEGCPLCSGDVFVGALAAAVAAVIGALLVAFAKHHMLRFALALVAYLTLLLSPTCNLVQNPSCLCTPKYSSRRRTPYAFRYRPPPLVAA